jgi:probable HAF family extracellular repeat protein
MKESSGLLLVRNASCLLVVLVIPSFIASSHAARFHGLGDLPGGPFFSVARAVSADGSVVVGTSQSSNGFEAFRWTATKGMLGLGDLPGGGFQSEASGISSDGGVIVGSGRSAAGSEAFYWTESGGMIGVGDLPGGVFASYASAVSADGRVIAGYSSSTRSGASYAEAFRWTSTNGMTSLGDLPGGDPSSFAFAMSADGSVIVGASGSGNATGGSWEAFRWSAKTGMLPLGDFPGGATNSVAYGISPDGAVIVGRGHTGVEDPFRWTTESGFVHLGFLPCDTWSTAFAASANGAIVVGDPNQSRGDCAFIWDAQHGMRNLRAVLSNDYRLNPAGWQLSSARAITSDGQIIVGSGINPAGQTEAWIADLRPSRLEFTLTGANIVLSWKTNGPTFVLQQSSSLGSPNNWSSNSAPVFRVGDSFVVTNAPMPQRFFRLKTP